MLTVSDSKNEQSYGKKLAAPYRFDDGAVFLSPENVKLRDALFHSGGMNFDVYSCRDTDEDFENSDDSDEDSDDSGNQAQGKSNIYCKLLI